MGDEQNSMDGPAPKRHADLLVTGLDFLVCVDLDRRIIRDGAVAVGGGRFLAVGTTSEIEQKWRAPKVVDGRHRVATPGFVDNHLHASFQLSRGLADEVNAQKFLFERMYPYEGTMGADDVYVSSLLASWELLRHGVTCFVDPGNYHPGETARACQEVGVRVVLSRSTFDRSSSVLGLLPDSMIESTDEAITAAQNVLEEYGGPIERGWSASASFRGLNNSSDDLIRSLHHLAGEHHTFLQTHGCFSYSTMDASVAQCGLSEVQRLEELGVLDEQLLLVHGGWLEPDDLRLLAERRPTVVHAPSSSFHNGYGNLEVGRIPELMALGVNVSLGSDHASSGCVDMCREMHLAACGHKEVRLNPRVMPPEHAVEMATRNGARGAGVADDLGSVEVGKLADLVLFDANQPEWLPLYNPISNLVYSVPGSTVATVLIGGKVVLDDGHLTEVDEDVIRGRVRRTSEAIVARLDPARVLTLRWPVVGAAVSQGTAS